jgi:hypothetical protein
MSKPFQFSMRRLFSATALFCVSMGLLAATPRVESGIVHLACFFGGFVAFGTAVGTMFGRPLAGAVVTLAGLAAVALLA